MALSDLAEGSLLDDSGITLKQDVFRGHKISANSIAVGEKVIRYGHTIGQAKVDIEAGETLLEVLRRLGYKSVKHGCETGECGACSVILDGDVVNSCMILAVQTENCKITTVEGIGKSLKPLTFISFKLPCVLSVIS